MNQASVEARPATVQCKPQLPKPLATIRRYGLAALSVSVALGAALLLERFHFRDVEVPLFLFALAIAAWYGGAGAAMKSKSKDGLSHVERATDLAQFGLSEARRSALSLHSDIIEESGLIEALKRLVERSNIPGLLRCSFRSSHVCEESLAPPIQQDLLRIAQEAISNALRHAQPTVISVSLRWNPPNLVLKIRDNGSGIADGRSSGGGFGFANMRARAKNLGAELDIRSTAGSGTSVVVRLPIIS